STHVESGAVADKDVGSTCVQAVLNLGVAPRAGSRGRHKSLIVCQGVAARHSGAPRWSRKTHAAKTFTTTETRGRPRCHSVTPRRATTVSYFSGRWLWRD
ncbi:Unknown protein, partial [Striga hermonthica]